jgi:hypothetical protein
MISERNCAPRPSWPSRETGSEKYLLGVARRGPISTLRQATFDPALYDALEIWRDSALADKMVLIGQLALNFHVKPRYVTCATFLSQLPVHHPPNGFRTAADCIFWHDKSGSIICIVSPACANLSTGTAQKILTTACLQDGINVASREAMIALRLSMHRPWREFQDCADIVDLLVGKSVEMSDWGLGPEHMQLLTRCRTMADAIGLS